MDKIFKVGDEVETTDNMKGIIIEIWALDVTFPYIVRLVDDTHDYYRASELKLAL